MDSLVGNHHLECTLPVVDRERRIQADHKLVVVDLVDSSLCEVAKVRWDISSLDH